MTIDKPQVPVNEMERLLSLSGFDVDFSDHKKSFNDLAKLAAMIAGTKISLVNLIDSYTQWTISNHGLDLDQMLREDSACQYTIMSDDHFEVGDMSEDERFKDKFYVTGDPLARYYFGVPLNVGKGLNIGALCVLDQEFKVLDPDKVALLKVIATEIVSRLKTFQVMDSLRQKVGESERTKMRVAHDIRGPLAGIVGLTEIIQDQGENNDMNEVLEFVSIIRDSGNSLLEMTGDMLKSPVGAEQNGVKVVESVFNLMAFKGKLDKLYTPQARQKNISLVIQTGPETESIYLPANKLVQITGNLVSNALKFTPYHGEVFVKISLEGPNTKRILVMEITDNGMGLDQENVQSILSGIVSSREGTAGEQGFGFGLALVKQMVEQLNGTLSILSAPGEGATFSVRLPLLQA